MSTLELQLEELLNKNPDSLVNAQKNAFRQLTANTGERFVLFGAGGLGQITLTGLRKVGVEPLAFTDNNPKLWGSMVSGLRVLSPQSAAEQFGTNSVFIITLYTNAPIWKQLTILGLKGTSFAALAWQYPQVFIPYFNVDYPHKIFTQSDDIRSACKLWSDEISSREYVGQLQWHCSHDPSVVPSHLPQNEIYFADNLVNPRADEVFVDCGAFDGDSVQEFVRRRSGAFNQIIAIEPDPVNNKKLEERISTMPVEFNDRIRIIRSALGSKHDIVTFKASGTVGAAVGNGSYQVQSAPLDDLLVNISPTFVKMDIEGAEPDALLGMQRIIKEHSPVLAVCLYHTQEHLWRVPLLIHSFRNDYDFFLRRYSDECWEIVCYAVPKHRSTIHSF